MNDITIPILGAPEAHGTVWITLPIPQVVLLRPETIITNPNQTLPIKPVRHASRTSSKLTAPALRPCQQQSTGRGEVAHHLAHTFEIPLVSWVCLCPCRYESFRTPLGRSARHFTALMLVAEQIAMERSAKALNASNANFNHPMKSAFAQSSH